jgi:hypothetical protein
MNVSEIARHMGLQRMAVARIRADPAAAEEMLANWRDDGCVQHLC